MEQSGGDGELADPSDAGADRLSGLPDDVLVLILLRLDTAANAARTSVLSHRWRRVWTLLPELCFPLLDPHRIASALAAHEAALRILLICTQDAAPDAVAAWLRVAAPRLSGRLTFINWAPGSNGDDDCEGDSEEDGGDRGAFELPCLEGATTVKLELGLSLGLAMPSAGVFFRLIDLSLSRLRFYGPCSLGDAISSPRCPCLQKLSVRDVRGLFNLSVHSGSLLQLDLWSLVGLQELVIDAPALKGLKLVNFLVGNQPVVKISAPELISLFWAHAYYPSSMQLSRMAQLQHLPMNVFFVHGDSFHRAHNRNCLRFLQQFQVIHSLTISLGCYGQDLSNIHYLLENITFLPRCMTLTIILLNEGHAFGAGLYHMLRLCTGIKTLFLTIDGDLEVQSVCPSGCICDQPTDWKTGQLSLNCLHEVEIVDLKGSEHEVALVKQLFNWSTILKKYENNF